MEVVESTSLAAGLVSQTDFDTTTKKLYDGDYLVMMTDGVLDALPGDRTEQMKQLLLEVKNSEPREFAGSFWNACCASAAAAHGMI